MLTLDPLTLFFHSYSLSKGASTSGVHEWLTAVTDRGPFLHGSTDVSTPIRSLADSVAVTTPAEVQPLRKRKIESTAEVPGVKKAKKSRKNAPQTDEARPAIAFGGIAYEDERYNAEHARAFNSPKKAKGTLPPTSAVC